MENLLVGCGADEVFVLTYSGKNVFLKHYSLLIYC